MKVKLYTRFANLDNQGVGRVTIDIINELSNKHKVMVNQTKTKSNLGYLAHACGLKALDIRRSNVNLAVTSMDTFYLDPNKSAVIVHDLIPLLHQFTTLTHYNRFPVNQIGSLVFFYYTLRKAITFKKVICISSKAKEELLSVFPDLDKDRLEVVPNSVQSKYVPQERENHKKKRLYFVGALDPRKRIGELVDWFIKWNPSDYELIVGGKGCLYQEIKSKVKGMDNIKLLGEVSEGDMVKNYKECDIFIFPTKNEGFGLPIIEAVSCKRPVIILEDSLVPDEVKECAFVSSWNNLESDIKKFSNNRFYNKFVNEKLKISEKFRYNSAKRISEILEEINETI